MEEILSAEDFFSLEGSPFQLLFAEAEYVWEGLREIKSFINNQLVPNSAMARRGNSTIEKDLVIYNGDIIEEGFEIDDTGKKAVVKRSGKVLEGASILFAGCFLMDDQIYIGNNTIVEPTALIKGPTYIGDNTEVRHGAYIRGNVLVGNNCVVGHATEIKSSVMLGDSKAGHFAYIGDSILGKVNLGAGTKLANLKMFDSPVVLNINNVTYETGLRKFGAIIGDEVETGCNSVTAPGTLLARNVLLYPNGTARGYYPQNTLIKIGQDQDCQIIR
ncbi:MAG: glucose-1-phosphate thymidylyltransferase [Bacillota bacterium]